MNRHSWLSKLAAHQRPLLACLVQLGLVAGAIALSTLNGVPWFGSAGGVVALALAALVSRTGVSARADLWLWWGSSLVFPASLWFCHPAEPVAVVSRALFLCLLGASSLVVSLRLADATSKARWRVTGLLWAFPGALLVVGLAYRHNLKLAFDCGLLFSLALLVAYEVWYRPCFLVVQVLNTLILFGAGLLVASLFSSTPAAPEPGPIKNDLVYRYSDASKDPGGFKHWWWRYTRQWGALIPALFEMHPDSPLFYRPRPGAQAMFLRSRVVLNQQGFRGKELAEPKGETYRIVALGESTTFGSTLNAEDQPWPNSSNK